MGRSGQIALVLFRAGRTDWEDAGRLQGRTDLPLSDQGASELPARVSELAERNGEASLQYVYCGPDEASRQTAQAISRRTGGKVKVLDGLAGMNLGLWEGLLTADLEDRYPTAYGQWREDPSSINPPEGETFSEAEERLLESLAKATEKAWRRGVAVVLRPMEFGLVRAWLAGQGPRALWTMVEDGPGVEAHTVSKGRFRELLEDLRQQLKA
ncbi:MAG: histidine phosphatase family protein [Phycisphaerales bacterium]|nr:histidine phosphatase family protein [Phycisphaerales bacterium]